MDAAQLPRMILAVLILVTLCGVASAAEAAPCEATTADWALRKSATKIVEPTYPVDAIRAKISGLVVADICVPLDSNIAVVDVLVAPDDSIRRAVVTAIRQWRFRPATTIFKTGVHSYGGKIIFYFLQREGHWTVLSSTDSFYVGPEFAGPPRTRFRK
jgi:hypothetical protein